MFGNLTKRLSSRNGSTLLVAMAVAAVMLILLTVVLRTSISNMKSSKGAVAQSEAYYLARGALNHAVAAIDNDPGLRGACELTVPREGSSMSYRVSVWGCYLKVEATGRVGRVTQQLTAYVGSLPDERYTHSVTILNGSYPLVLAGRAGIIGKTYLCQPLVLSGELQGRQFRGKLPDQTKMKIASHDLPQFESPVVREFLENLEASKQNCGKLTDLSVVISADRFVDSGCLKTYGQIDINLRTPAEVISHCRIFADRSVKVRGSSSLYQVVLQSNTSITISSSARLVDCVLVAPMINVTQSSSVASQLIATEEITVSGKAQLGSQSVLYLLHEEAVNDTISGITLSSFAPCSATVVYDIEDTNFSRPKGKADQPGVVLLSEHSRLVGRIVSDGYVELRGTLIGACTSELFYHHERPTTYLNWIVNGTVYYSADVARSVMPHFVSKGRQFELLHVTIGN